MLLGQRFPRSHFPSVSDFASRVRIPHSDESGAESSLPLLALGAFPCWPSGLLVLQGHLQAPPAPRPVAIIFPPFPNGLL